MYANLNSIGMDIFDVNNKLHRQKIEIVNNRLSMFFGGWSKIQIQNLTRVIIDSEIYESIVFQIYILMHTCVSVDL